MATVRPFRCFNSRVIVISVLVALALLGLAWAGHAVAPRSALRMAIALAEAAAVGWLVVELVRSIRGLDELERSIHVEALAAAAAIMVTVVSGWGFLAKAGLPAVDWGVWIFPFLSFAWVFGVLRVRRRYL